MCFSPHQPNPQVFFTPSPTASPRPRAEPTSQRANEPRPVPQPPPRRHGGGARGGGGAPDPAGGPRVVSQPAVSKTDVHIGKSTTVNPWRSFFSSSLFLFFFFFWGVNAWGSLNRLFFLGLDHIWSGHCRSHMERNCCI